MAVEHHNLAHDFPELKNKIHELKTTNNHFRRLFDEYHDLTTDIEKIEDEITPATTGYEQDQKRRRAQLKDELYAMLTA